jgi:S-methylmethionine-dependent homocysteine/selenocysteine methylase
VTGHYLTQLPVSPAYERVAALLRDGRTVVLDGGVATELQRVGDEDRAQRHEPWGSWALFRGPMDVLEVHRRYVRAGCDVISTNTWSVLEAARESRGSGRAPLWLDAARLAIRLARRAIDESGGGERCAVAFCINSSLLDAGAPGHVELLSYLWSEEPPDLVILETLESVPGDAALETVAMAADTGLPVWMSFRLPLDGMDGLAAALDRLAAIGVGAILVNCIPLEGIPDAVGWLRRQTTLPIGCYPNAGHGHGARWEFDDDVQPADYARLARSWTAAGAQIVGGCCGITPEHLAAVRASVTET